MSKFVIVVVMVATVYVAEANLLPEQFNPNNMLAAFGRHGFPNIPNFDTIKAMRPQDGGQMSGMAISTSTRDDGVGGPVSHGQILVNRNGKLYESSYKK